MKTLSKTLMLLLFLPALLIANNEKLNGKHSKEKTIKKEYNVNSDARLEVSNSFGNVDIVSWNENRIVIEVTITTNGSNEEKVQKRLDDIDVEFTASSSLVSAVTTFKNKRNSWNWFGNNKNKTSMEINYKIKMPISNSLDINNDYGAININKLEGQAKINCDYGQLIIGELMADDNYLNFDYTSNSTIGYMKSGKINADYSGFSLDNVNSLDLNADYTNSSIGEVSEIKYNCDYGKVNIDKVTNLIGEGDYVSHRIGIVNGGLSINADYGSIKVAKLTSSVKDATIKADYTSIKLGFDSGYNFDFTINLQYASLNGDDNVIVKHTSKDNGSKKYSGYHGNENSGNTLNIKSNYGGVTLTKH